MYSLLLSCLLFQFSIVLESQQPSTTPKPYEPAEQDTTHLEIDVALAPMREHAGHGRRDDLRRLRGHGDGRRNAPEHQERRQDEAAAHAEHARKKAHRGAEPDDEEDIHRHLGDGQIDLHGCRAGRTRGDTRPCSRLTRRARRG